MATQSPVKETVEPSPEIPPATTSNSVSLSIKAEIPATDSREISTPISSRLPDTSPSGIDVITIPSYSRWFSWDKIHESERRFLPEFFDGRSPSKNPMVYKYYRDLIITKYRKSPSRKITFTEVRKVLVGDVGSIRRVFDFLEGWGLINYTGIAVKLQSKWEEKETKSSGDLGGSPSLDPSLLLKKESSKKLCSGCKSVCSIACFVCDKFDLTLCARCYVRGNYRVGVSSSDFRRVEISEETKTGWTDKETLHLLEAIMHYGDDWKKVAEHVGGRSEKECVARFIKLPFGEQFVGHPDSEDFDKYYQMKEQSDTETGAENVLPLSPPKRRRLAPLADASNPIIAQAAFLSAMVGLEVAKAATQAAVAALYEGNLGINQRGSRKSKPDETEQKEYATDANGDTTMSTLEEEAVVEAQALIKKEEQDLERSISGILEVQMKEIQDRIVHFEEVELQMEKERQQLQHMKNLLFADQLALLFRRSSPLTSGDNTQEVVKTTDTVT